MLQSLQEQIREVCKVVAKEKGFQLIVNSELVYYGDPDRDCTSQVIQILDQKAENTAKVDSKDSGKQDKKEASSPEGKQEKKK
jgi:hypothetical protein